MSKTPAPSSRRSASARRSIPVSKRKHGPPGEAKARGKAEALRCLDCKRPVGNITWCWPCFRARHLNNEWSARACDVCWKKERKDKHDADCPARRVKKKADLAALRRANSKMLPKVAAKTGRPRMAR